MRHTDRAPGIPPDLAGWYGEAIQNARDLAVQCLKEDVKEEDLRVILGTIAVFQGHYKIGMAIFDLEETEDCPNCEKEFTTRGYDLF